jgi:hypothetical protein
LRFVSDKLYFRFLVFDPGPLPEMAAVFPFLRRKAEAFPPGFRSTHCHCHFPFRDASWVTRQSSLSVSLLLTGAAIEGARRGNPFMPDKRLDSSEVADSIQHLNGRIDAVLYLVSVVAGTISPALAVPLLNRIGELKAKAQSGPLSALRKALSGWKTDCLKP